MGHVRRGPGEHRQHIAALGADPVDHPAEGEEADPVRGLEPEDDVAITPLGPVIEALQRRLQHRDGEPVDIGEDDRGEEQSADDPAHPPLPPGGKHRGGGGGGVVHALTS